MEAPIVVIARFEHLPAWRRRIGTHAALSVFADAESIQALEAILKQPPKILALDLTFAATARGAALVARVRTEARLTSIDVRVLIDDENNVPLMLAQPMTSPERTLLQTSRPLDRAGTRRAVRFPMNGRAVIVNGESSHLVDLSVTGAQVVAPQRLRPAQPLRMIVLDGSREIRCHGTVAWSIAVPTGAMIQYRAGVEFIDPDPQMVEAFCLRHRNRGERP